MPDADTGTTHAVISVERSLAVEGPHAVSANAMARFVSVPPHAEPIRVLAAMGLGLGLPDMDHCSTAQELEPELEPAASLGPVEFIEAGDVVLSADGLVTTLAPHAFPAVSDFASGVVYTTRDRDADPLPAGVAYTLNASGSGPIPAIHVEGAAPDALDSVTINGLPLEEITELSLNGPLDLTWSVGEAVDVVYVELVAYDGSAPTLCAFRNEDGAGTVPAHAFDGRGEGRLALHRVRTSEFDAPGLHSGELRFDFQLTTSVTFGD